MFKNSFIFVVILGLCACDEPAQKNTTTAENLKPVAPKQIIQKPEVSEQKILDLSIPKERKIILGENLAVPDKNILPDFFKEQKKEKDTVLNARLLNDPSNPDYIDSLQGAEVSVEIKLN